MILGIVGEWLARLPEGKAVILTREDIQDSAKYYMESDIFDHIRPEYLKAVIDEVNSAQYPGFSLWERPDDGRWILERNAPSDKKGAVR